MKEQELFNACWVVYFVLYELRNTYKMVYIVRCENYHHHINKV